MHGIILRNAMTLQLSVRLFRWSVPVKNAQTSPLTDCICRYFLALLAVIFHPSFLIFFFVSGRDIPWTTSPTSLCHQIYQKHFQYNNYNNRNHVHSPNIYSYFQRASPQGLAKNSEGTMITKGNFVTSCKGTFRYHFVCVFFAQRSCKNYIALVHHTGWRNLYLKRQI